MVGVFAAEALLKDRDNNRLSNEKGASSEYLTIVDNTYQFRSVILNGSEERPLEVGTV